jgi:UDP-glucose 4-epimerase
MNVVVVGGAGFIGSHLVDRLLAEDHQVDVIDDLSTGTLGNLADARSVGGSLKIHHLDAAAPEATSLIGMRRPDVIYDLALFPRGERGGAAIGSIADLGAGFNRSLAVLDAARQHGVGKVVVALPASVLYGFPAANSLPAKEADPVPRGIRGVVARSVLDLLTVYRENDMIEFAALSLASVYGPRQSAGGGVVAAFEAAIEAGRPPEFHGDGRQTRDFVFIDDVVDALVRSADRSSGLLINIGTGQQTAVRDLWQLMSDGRLDEPTVLPDRRNELQRFAVSPVRARIHLGWSPWTELAEGVARLRHRDGSGD